MTNTAYIILQLKRDFLLSSFSKSVCKISGRQHAWHITNQVHCQGAAKGLPRAVKCTPTTRGKWGKQNKGNEEEPGDKMPIIYRNPFSIRRSPAPCHVYLILRPKAKRAEGEGEGEGRSKGKRRRRGRELEGEGRRQGRKTRRDRGEGSSVREGNIQAPFPSSSPLPPPPTRQISFPTPPHNPHPSPKIPKSP